MQSIHPLPPLSFRAGEEVLDRLELGEELGISVRADFSRPAEAGPHTEEQDDLVPLEESERRHIEAVLRATAGNQTQAALILGIERKTLARKMKRLGIT